MDENSILEVNEKGLIYVDEDGTRKAIDFYACYENYLKKWRDPARLEGVKRANNMDDERLSQFLTRLEQFREIGERNPLEPPWADGPYIEFYTEPPTRFRFRSMDEYIIILESITQAGWRTFDQG